MGNRVDTVENGTEDSTCCCGGSPLTRQLSAQAKAKISPRIPGQEKTPRTQQKLREWIGDGWTKTTDAQIVDLPEVCEPHGLCKGQWQWVDPGSGGNTHSMAFHPQCPDTLFVGSDVNGILRGYREVDDNGDSVWQFEEFGKGINGYDTVGIAIGKYGSDARMYCLGGGGIAGQVARVGRRMLFRYAPEYNKWMWIKTPGYHWRADSEQTEFFPNPAGISPNDEGELGDLFTNDNVSYMPQLAAIQVVDLPRPYEDLHVLLGIGPTAPALEYIDGVARTGFVKTDTLSAPALLVGVPTDATEV